MSRAKATGSTKATSATQGTGVPKTTGTNPKPTQGQQRGPRPRPTPAHKGPVRKGPTIRKQKHTQLYLMLGVLGLIVIGGFILLVHAQAGGSPADAQPVHSTVLQEVTGVSPTTWEAIGTGGVTQPFTPVAGQAALKGSNGQPVSQPVPGFCATRNRRQYGQPRSPGYPDHFGAADLHSG